MLFCKEFQCFNTIYTLSSNALTCALLTQTRPSLAEQAEAAMHRLSPLDFPPAFRSRSPNKPNIKQYTR